MSNLQSYPGKGKSSNKMYYRIQPYLDGRRITIRLGSGKKQAITAAKAINDIIDSLNAKVDPSPNSKNWLATVASESICQKLLKHGLIRQLPERFAGQAITTIEMLASEYIRTRCAGHEPATVTVVEKAKRNLLSCFGDVDIKSLKKKDGREFWRWLRDKNAENLAENTAKQRLRYARAFFELAIEDELVAINPFKARGLSVSQTAAEKVYVESNIVQQIIDKCPDDEWKLFFAMVRTVPMRIPVSYTHLTLPTKA